MAKATAYIALTDDEWTAIAAADDYSAFGFQVSGQPIALLIANSAPAIDDNDYIVLSNNGEKSFSEEIPAGYTLYARSIKATGGIRGYRIPAA